MSTLPALTDIDTLTRTRRALHAVAEQVLASTRHHAVSRIGLRATAGGFGTPPYERDDHEEELRVVRSELHVRRGEDIDILPLTTLTDAASAVGRTPGPPEGTYEPTTTAIAADTPLDIDDDSAELLASWYEMTWAALEALHADARPDEGATEPQLWPEHFDAAIDLGAEDAGMRATYGGSPGDQHHAEPYLYVQHWQQPPADEFWNEQGFGGATLLYEALQRATDPVADALAFFQRGRALLSPSA